VAGGAEAPVVEDAAALAHLDAGAQEVWERVGAGEPVVLVDVRAAEERVVGVIPGARMLPLTELEARSIELMFRLYDYKSTGRIPSHLAKNLFRELGIDVAPHMLPPRRRRPPAAGGGAQR
jgi:rhodanese-related sulfurtransferase